MAEIFYKRPFIKGSGGSRGTGRSTDTAARSAGKVGVKSEPWVSLTGCVWKHDTLCRPTLALRRRPPGLERNTGCRRAGHCGCPAVRRCQCKLIKGQVKGITPAINGFPQEKGLPDVSSPLVTLNLPNPHRHHSLCPAGLRGTAPCPLPVSWCGCCSDRWWSMRVLSVSRH